MRCSLNYYRSKSSGLDQTSQSIFTPLGGGEVALTKGLAATIASDPDVALRIVEHSGLAACAQLAGVTLDQLRSASDLTIDSEERQTKGVGARRDLVLRFSHDGQRLLTVILEAKHVDGVSGSGVMDQLGGYLDHCGVLDRPSDNKIGATLTRAEVPPARSDAVSLTWIELTEILMNSKTGLSHQFAKHVRESMRITFFQSEVYSVPTGASLSTLEKTFIHAFPQSYSAPICLYLAPRLGGGGEIPRLYRVESVYDVADRTLEAQIERISDTEPEVAARMNAYFSDRFKEPVRPDDELRVFVLGKKPIELPHRPKPKRNNPFKTSRWSLADLLDSSMTVLPS